MKLNIDQNTPEWLELRLKKIGASDAPIIMGLGRMTKLQLWEVKNGMRVIESNAAMERGKNLEERARQAFYKYTGIKVVPAVYQCDDNPFMIASLDGISRDGKTIVEIKCLGALGHLTAVENKIPEEYYPQLQHQIAVMKLDRNFYFSYYDDDNVKLLEVKRDQNYINELIVAEKAFYKNMVDFTAPEFSSRDYRPQNSEEWIATAEEYIENQKILAEYQKYEEKDRLLRQKLIELSDGNNCIGGGIKMTKIIQRGHINYGAIPELKGVDLEKYRKEPIVKWKPQLI